MDQSVGPGITPAQRATSTWGYRIVAPVLVESQAPPAETQRHPANGLCWLALGDLDGVPKLGLTGLERWKADAGRRNDKKLYRDAVGHKPDATREPRRLSRPV